MQGDMSAVDKPEYLESAIALKMQKHFMSSSVEPSEIVDFDLSLDDANGIFNATHHDSLDTNVDSRALNRNNEDQNYSMEFD